MQTNKAVAIAGNMIVDQLKPIEKYPECGNLTSIFSVDQAVGGALCNVIVDLARLGPALPLVAIGVLGADDAGDFILRELAQYKNIDTSRIARSGVTSFTDVMADESTKARTFFHYRGANSLLDLVHFDLDALADQVSLLHIGYILLLDALDAVDAQYGTVMAHLLHECQKRSIRTSIDVVSEEGGRFARLVPPALRYADECIINEVEASMSTLIPLRSADGQLLKENMEPALRKLLELGVSHWAVIHTPEAAFGMEAAIERLCVCPSLLLPNGYIKGSVGAGDAFCSGVLYGLCEGATIEEAMGLGAATAASSLSESGATAGVKSAQKTRALLQQFPRQAI